MQSISAETRGGLPGAGASTFAARAARFTPVAIVVYFALQLAIRLCLSANLEVDDAEMVGQIGWAWGYPNSHPPLYHWIVRICYDAFGDWTAATAVSKFVLLAAGYLLIFDAGRRAGGNPVSGAIAVAGLLFIPVVVWKAEGKLTHSILGFTATAATLHALVVVLRRGKARHFAWLGAAAASGLLAKYNFLLVLGALLLTIVVLPEVRRAFRAKAALLAIGIPVVLTAPHWWWMRAHPQAAAERLYMLNTGGGPFGLNLRASTVMDGLLSLGAVSLVSVAPALLVCGGACMIFRRPNGVADEGAVTERRAIGVLVLAELLIFAFVVVSGGFTQVHERYLMVLLPPVPLWLALRFVPRREAAAAGVLALALSVGGVVTIARPISVMRSENRLGFPYAEWATAIAESVGASFAVLADRPENAANIATRLPSATIYDSSVPAARVLAVADDSARLQEVVAQLGGGYSPVGDTRVLTGPLRWDRSREVSIVAQLLERRD